MIQDIFPHKFDNHYRHDVHPGDDDILFSFKGENILCRVEGTEATFPRVKDYAGTGSLIYLFSVDIQHFFLTISDNPLISGNFEYVHIRNLRKKDTVQKPLIFAAITAWHLNDWYRANRFCGCCSAPLEHSSNERAMFCPSCGRIFYPRINPAVIVGVTNGDSLLLTKYAGKKLPFYALVAGFTEIGESFEETVRREVMEETGLRVTNIRYYKSQPWGFAADILAGYFCDAAGDTSICVDTNELKEAIWMPRADVPGQPDDFSLTNEMMCAFRDGLI